MRSQGNASAHFKISKREFVVDSKHTHDTGDRETTWEEVEDARTSRLEQASSSVPKVKEQTDVKSSNSQEASPATGAKNPLSMVGKM